MDIDESWTFKTDLNGKTHDMKYLLFSMRVNSRYVRNMMSFTG